MHALERLLTEEQRWSECIDVLYKRAAVQDDDQARRGILLHAAQLWLTKVEDVDKAAAAYEEVRAQAPDDALASEALETIYRDRGEFEKLTEVLLERVEHSESRAERIGLFQRVAAVYENDVGDPESAFIVLQAAFREDFSNETTAAELERLATETGKWERLAIRLLGASDGT